MESSCGVMHRELPTETSGYPAQGKDPGLYGSIRPVLQGPIGGCSRARHIPTDDGAEITRQMQNTHPRCSPLGSLVRANFAPNLAPTPKRCSNGSSNSMMPSTYQWLFSLVSAEYSAQAQHIMAASRGHGGGAVNVQVILRCRWVANRCCQERAVLHLGDARMREVVYFGCPLSAWGACAA